MQDVNAHVFTWVEQTSDGVLLHAELPSFISEPYVILYSSADLKVWKEEGRIHNATRIRYLVASATNDARFFRFTHFETPPSDWSNQISVYSEPYGSYNVGIPYVKFVIKTDEPEKVYFAANNFLFHYDFVAARIEPFIGIPRDAFDNIARHNAGRQLLLGAVLMPSDRSSEYGIQFESEDPLPFELVRQGYEAVRRRVVETRSTAMNQPTAFYVPTFEQTAVTFANRPFFETNDIPVTLLERWMTLPAAYSSGFAVGTLKFVAATNINAAYASGELSSTNILVTDGVPAELPYVAGIITLRPATYNSHVAILADTYHVPFGYLPGNQEAARILSLVGKEVVLETVKQRLAFASGEVNLVPVSDTLTAELRDVLKSFQPSRRITIQPYELPGVLTTRTDTLTPADIKYYGGKAANFGFLRRALPNESPEAIAFSFQLWDDFMRQVLPGGRTLREEINARIAPLTNLNEIARIRTELANIQSLIRRTAQFTPQQQTNILAALAGFDRRRNIRFRSSTNVEDSENFTGAGLYDSFSGCLTDDLDADTNGPSACDPTEEGERGVFRAIQRVFASFYNENAFIARRLYALNEDETGMALLVHYSVPDAIELANGVATYRYELRGTNDWIVHYKLVTQKGAVSVTNPEATARPEVIDGMFTTNSSFEYFGNGSDLVPLGARVLDSEEYGELVGLLRRAAEEVARYTNKTLFALDFEYKKIAPGVLSIKQVRPLPLIDNTQSIDPVMLEEVIELCSAHRINTDAFRMHRLKSRWLLRTRNMIVTTNSLAEQGLFSQIAVTKAGHGQPFSFSGTPEQLNARVEIDWKERSLALVWDAETSDGPAEFALVNRLYFNGNAPKRSLMDSLLFRLRAYSMEVRAEYKNPVHFIDWSGDIHTNTTESLYLYECLPPEGGAFPFHWDLLVTNATETISMTVDYAMDSPDVYVGYPNVVGALKSEIRGLTTKPITLRSLYSQTFEGVHWRTGERFIFEPQLEEGIDPEILAELRAKNIRLLLYTHPGRNATLRALGYNGILREIAWGTFASE